MTNGKRVSIQSAKKHKTQVENGKKRCEKREVYFSNIAKEKPE